MHDYSLGPPVDVGSYDGPMLDNKPIHSGNCEDGVYGCTKCNRAARSLTPEQLDAIGWPKTDYCDWCRKETSIKDISGIKPWDEPSCYYEICKDCRNKYDKELQNEIDYDMEQTQGYDD